MARCVLVTDASSPAGASPGRYTLGEQAVDLTDDQRVVLAGTDKLAGSALRIKRTPRDARQKGSVKNPSLVTTARPCARQVMADVLDLDPGAITVDWR